MNQELKSRLASLKSAIMKLKSYEEITGLQAANLENSALALRSKADLYARCSEIFKKWLEDSVEKNVSSMASLVTTGLQFVIRDQELVFRIKQEQKYNRIAMRFILEQDGMEGDPLASYGGGAAVVVSLILRIAIMQRMGMGNLLILDESMVALANAYVPSAAAFMRQLSEETGVNILMVTHNPEFIASAHTAYECHKDTSLKLRKVGSSNSQV